MDPPDRISKAGARLFDNRYDDPGGALWGGHLPVPPMPEEC